MNYESSKESEHLTQIDDDWRVQQTSCPTGSILIWAIDHRSGARNKVALTNFDPLCQSTTPEQREAVRLETARLIAAAPAMLKYLETADDPRAQKIIEWMQSDDVFCIEGHDE